MRISSALALAAAAIVSADTSASTVSSFSSNGQVCYVVRTRTETSTSQSEISTTSETSSFATTSTTEGIFSTTTQAPSTTTESTATSSSSSPTTTGPPSCPTIVQDPSFENVPLSDKSATNFATDVWSFAGSGATIATNGDLGSSTTPYGSVFAYLTSSYNTNTDGSRTGPLSTISQTINGLSTTSSYSVGYHYGASMFTFGAASPGGQGGPSRTAGCDLILSFAGVEIDTLRLVYFTDSPPSQATAFRSTQFTPTAANGQLQLSFRCLERDSNPGIRVGNGAFLIDEFTLGITNQICT